MRMKFLAVAVAIIMTLPFSGRGAGHGGDVATPDPELRGELQTFIYSYGSYWGGRRRFSITVEAADPAAPKYFFTAKGSNGVKMDAKGYIGRRELDSIAAVIKENGIFSWNGFNERSSRILDGYGFALKAEFTDGTIAAIGYEEYPDNYKQGHTALSACLIDIADSLAPKQ